MSDELEKVREAVKRVRFPVYIESDGSYTDKDRAHLNYDGTDILNGVPALLAAYESAVADAKSYGEGQEKLRAERDALHGEILEQEYSTNPDEWPDLDNEEILHLLRRAYHEKSNAIVDRTMLRVEVDALRKRVEELEKDGRVGMCPCCGAILASPDELADGQALRNAGKEEGR